MKKCVCVCVWAGKLVAYLSSWGTNFGGLFCRNSDSLIRFSSRDTYRLSSSSKFRDMATQQKARTTGPLKRVRKINTRA